MTLFNVEAPAPRGRSSGAVGPGDRVSPGVSAPGISDSASPGVSANGPDDPGPGSYSIKDDKFMTGYLTFLCVLSILIIMSLFAGKVNAEYDEKDDIKVFVMSETDNKNTYYKLYTTTDARNKLLYNNVTIFVYCDNCTSWKFSQFEGRFFGNLVNGIDRVLKKGNFTVPWVVINYGFEKGVYDNLKIVVDNTTFQYDRVTIFDKDIKDRVETPEGEEPMEWVNLTKERLIVGGYSLTGAITGIGLAYFKKKVYDENMPRKK